MTLTQQRNFQLQSIQGTIKQGGYTATISAFDDTAPVEYGQRVRLMGQSLAGGIQDAEPALIGDWYVTQSPPFQFDALTRRLTFNCGTADQLLRHIGIQDIPYDEITPSTNPHQIVPPMTFSDMLTEALGNHSNFVFDAVDNLEGIIFDTDIETGDTTLPHYSLPQSRNMWQTLTSKLGGGEEGGVQFFRIWFTRKGVLTYQPAPMFRSPALTSVADLTTAHLLDQVRVTIREPQDRTSQVRLSAVGATAGQTFNAEFPTTATLGSPFKKTSGIWANSQAQTDDYAERVYRWKTRPFTVQATVDEGMVLFGSDGRGIELGDMVTLTIDGPAINTATGGGMHLTWSLQEFFVYGIQITYDNARQVGRGILTLEANN